MSGKFFLYVAVTFLVIWAMDSVNINKIFKQLIKLNILGKIKNGKYIILI